MLDFIQQLHIKFGKSILEIKNSIENNHLENNVLMNFNDLAYDIAENTFSLSKFLSKKLL